MYNKKHNNHKLSTYCHGLINQDLHLSDQKLVKKKKNEKKTDFREIQKSWLFI
jgi:hypothetical protein